jgi:hypothetical protein
MTDLIRVCLQLSREEINGGDLCKGTLHKMAIGRYGDLIELVRGLTLRDVVLLLCSVCT